MSGSALSQRLAAFRQNFKQILGPKRQGYDELAQLEQPLVVGDNQTEAAHDQYLRQHGVTRPGTGGSVPSATNQSAVPSQTEELQLLCSLGREAAAILWEMAALQEETSAAKEMLEKGELLKAQLRGMIGDYKGGDETLLATALEVFDSLSNTMSEYETALSPRASQAPAASKTTHSAGRLPPPSYQQNPFQPGTAVGATAPGKKAEEEAPLISFD